MNEVIEKCKYCGRDLEIYEMYNCEKSQKSKYEVHKTEEGTIVIDKEAICRVNFV